MVALFGIIGKEASLSRREHVSHLSVKSRVPSKNLILNSDQKRSYTCFQEHATTLKFKIIDLDTL